VKPDMNLFRDLLLKLESLPIKPGEILVLNSWTKRLQLDKRARAR
jgi:hypothetical protein